MEFTNIGFREFACAGQKSVLVTMQVAMIEGTPFYRGNYDGRLYNIAIGGNGDEKWFSFVSSGIFYKSLI